MKLFLRNYIALIFCCLLAVSCEIDNYDAPDATIQGTFYDHTGQPLLMNHGSEYLRMREVSWAKGDTNVVIANRNLKVQQDGTYRHTKQFSGEYRMFPFQGNFFPYWDANDPIKDGDDAGELVTISGVTTKDFTVTPYLTIDWVNKPTIDADGYLECTVRFRRNQKPGYDMPDLREARLQVSRTINVSGANDGDYYPSPLTVTNAMEGQDIKLRTVRALKYRGTDYHIRVTINCQTAAGNANTNYPGMGQPNCTTTEKIHYQ